MTALLRFVHLLALGLWIGSVVFFSLVVAPGLFGAVAQVVQKNSYSFTPGTPRARATGRKHRRPSPNPLSMKHVHCSAVASGVLPPRF